MICTPPCGDRPFNSQLNKKMGCGNVSYRDLWWEKCQAVLGLEIKLRKRLEGKSATAITLAIQASPIKEAKAVTPSPIEEAKAISPSPVQEAKDVRPSPPRDATDPPSMLDVLKQLNGLRRMEDRQRHQQQQLLK